MTTPQLTISYQARISRTDGYNKPQVTSFPPPLTFIFYVGRSLLRLTVSTCSRHMAIEKSFDMDIRCLSLSASMESPVFTQKLLMPFSFESHRMAHGQVGYNYMIFGLYESDKAISRIIHG